MSSNSKLSYLLIHKTDFAKIYFIEYVKVCLLTIGPKYSIIKEFHYYVFIPLFWQSESLWALWF